MGDQGAVTDRAKALNAPGRAYPGPTAALDRRARRARMIEVLPAGRALDLEDLQELVDQGNTSARANLMRARLLVHAVRTLPAGVLLNPAEVERVGQVMDERAPLHAVGQRPERTRRLADVAPWEP